MGQHLGVVFNFFIYPDDVFVVTLAQIIIAVFVVARRVVTVIVGLSQT